MFSKTNYFISLHNLLKGFKFFRKLISLLINIFTKRLLRLSNYTVSCLFQFYFCTDTLIQFKKKNF